MASIYLSIVIPAYNEETRLLRTLQETVSFLNRQKYTSEIIVVSDGSTDWTKETALSFAGNFRNLRVIEYFPNRGKGYAVKKGMLEARGEYRLFMDADYAVPVESVSPFLALIRQNYDIVIGSRGLQKSTIGAHQSFFRELAGKIFGVIQRKMLGLPFSDTQCGFKLFTRNTAMALFPKIRFHCATFDAELLYMAYHGGFLVGELGVSWSHDAETRLPIGAKRMIELFKQLFIMKQLHGNE